MLGRHIIIDLKSCYLHTLTDASLGESEFVSACNRAGATVLDTQFRSFGEDLGYTGLVLLAESHVSVHTWPEYSTALIDVFTCGTSADTDMLSELLVEFFGGTVMNHTTLMRGCYANSD